MPRSSEALIAAIAAERDRDAFRELFAEWAGSEVTLVLSVGFEDRGEHYARGDLSLCDPSVTHTIHVDRGDPCIALVVNDARLVPKGPFSNFVALFVDF